MATQLLATLEAEDSKESKFLHQRHPSNVYVNYVTAKSTLMRTRHLLLQEIRRLRTENDAIKTKYDKLELATLSMLNHMLEQKSPIYETAFAEVKKAMPELKEAHVRAVILQEQ